MGRDTKLCCGLLDLRLLHPFFSVVAKPERLNMSRPTVAGNRVGLTLFVPCLCIGFSFRLGLGDKRC